jgi:ornithine carbamoyltransferase
MGHSYVLAGVTAGTCASPRPPPTRRAPTSSPTPIASATTGGSVTLYTVPNEAAARSDVIVTDTWVSMGKEEEKIQRVHDLGGYKVTQETMDLADPDAIFIHCLPPTAATRWMPRSSTDRRGGLG